MIIDLCKHTNFHRCSSLLSAHPIFSIYTSAVQYQNCELLFHAPPVPRSPGSNPVFALMNCSEDKVCVHPGCTKKSDFLDLLPKRF